MALGSAFELETQLLICGRRNYGDSSQLEDILLALDQQQKMIIGFQKYINKAA